MTDAMKQCEKLTRENEELRSENARLKVKASRRHGTPLQDGIEEALIHGPLTTAEIMKTMTKSHQGEVIYYPSNVLAALRKDPIRFVQRADKTWTLAAEPEAAVVAP